MCTEFVQFFIQHKTGGLGRDFEQHAAGFTEVNGMKISAVDNWRDVVAEINEMLGEALVQDDSEKSSAGVEELL